MHSVYHPTFFDTRDKTMNFFDKKLQFGEKSVEMDKEISTKISIKISIAPGAVFCYTKGKFLQRSAVYAAV